MGRNHSWSTQSWSAQLPLMTLCILVNPLGSLYSELNCLLARKADNGKVEYVFQNQKKNTNFIANSIVVCFRVNCYPLGMSYWRL